MSFSEMYLNEAISIIKEIDRTTVEKIAKILKDTRDRNGRVFILGVGGGAANASHVVNDFRKLAGLQTYAPTDNVSELTARTNDEGWASVFIEWLKTSRLSGDDLVFIFSVGGGNLEKNISPNLVSAIDHAKSVGASICGVVGRDGGYTGKMADAAIIVPTVSLERITPHTEAIQMLIAHLLVSHPSVQTHETKWESVK